MGTKKNRIQYIELFKRNILLLYILFLEMICLLFEYNGGRAASLSVDWTTAFKITFDTLYSYLLMINWPICIFMIFIMIVGMSLGVKQQKNEFFKLMYTLIASEIIVVVYMILLFSRIGGHKFSNPTSIFTLIAYFFIIFSLSMSLIVHNYKKVIFLIQILIPAIAIYVITGEYMQSMAYYDDVEINYSVNKNIIEQFIHADTEGKEMFELHVPEDGLGRAEFSGDRIANTLYKHGIIKTLSSPILVLENLEYFIEDNVSNID